MIKFNKTFPEIVVYTPTENDLNHLNTIREFLNYRQIPYEEDTEVFGVFHLNDRTLQLRYVNSYYHPMDNSKRFGEKCKGIPHNYFIDISHCNADNDIRTIWIFDFEMEQTNTIIKDGVEIKDYHRQWEVIKNTICTACGKIDTRIYARDCEVREITNREARPFLDTNCFYGYRSATNTVALFLKKDKGHLKKGTMLMVYSFGHGFYANKKHQEDPSIEIIRVSTTIGVQVIGGMSKCLKHFLMEHPTMIMGGKEFPIDNLIFYCDASHNDSRGMQAGALNFDFISWDGCGFMNRWVEDHFEIVEKDGKKIKFEGKKGQIFHRKPMFHKEIMRLIGEGKIVSIANAGTIVYHMTRIKFLEKS